MDLLFPGDAVAGGLGLYRARRVADGHLVKTKTEAVQAQVQGRGRVHGDACARAGGLLTLALTVGLVPVDSTRAGPAVITAGAFQEVPFVWAVRFAFVWPQPAHKVPAVFFTQLELHRLRRARLDRGHHHDLAHRGLLQRPL